MDEVDEYHCLTLRLYYKTARYTSEAKLLTTLSIVQSPPIDNKMVAGQGQSLHHRPKWNLCHIAGQWQPCVVWSWRLNECFALALAVKGLWYTALSVHRSDWRRLCHAEEPQRGKNSCPWQPLPGWYGFAHVWGTGQAVCWCMSALYFQFVLSRFGLKCWALP